MSFSTNELSNLKLDAWDDYVMRTPQSTFFHLSGWSSVLNASLSHRAHSVYAESNGTIVGILPLVEMRSRLFGHTLSSSPFCVSGGVVADNPDVAKELTELACRKARQLGVDSLELRGGGEPGPDWLTKDLYVNFRRELADNDDENMKAIPRKQRAVVRKSIASDLLSEPCENVDRFFSIYAESVRNLGTPVFSKRLFHTLRHTFGDDCRMLMVTKEGRDVAAVMSFYFRGEVLPYYGGGISEARGMRANDFMYWELMRRATAEGIRFFDYGRSKIGSGSYSFKKNWGFEPLPVPYHYHLIRSKSMPEINPNNPKYKMAIDTWKRLPLPVANTLGPMLSRTLG